MITFAGYSMKNIRQWRALTTDIVTKDSKLLTNNDGINEVLLNGDEIYCMNGGDTYLYDKENGTLIKQ